MLAASEHDFIDLHTQHFTRVYRYIAYRINDLPRAEELAADVFRIVWEKQPAEPPSITTPDALRLKIEPSADCGRYDSLRRVA